MRASGSREPRGTTSRWKPAFAPATWTGVVLVLAKFGFGIAAFAALATAGALVGAMLAAPWLYDDAAVTLGLVEPTPGAYSVGPWIVDTLPEALAVAGVGVVGLVVALELLNALARFHARYTALLLGAGEDGSE